MSDLINKYIDLNEEFLRSLIRYTDLKNRFIKRPSVDGTKALRFELRKMRKLCKELHDVAQLRRQEYGAEWKAAQLKNRKIKNE
jgi:hypothetical protein